MNWNNKKDASPNSLLPDGVVIQRVLGGERELFEILMRRYNELLYRTLRSYLSVDADVEDTMQDTYVKAYQKLYQFKQEAMFSTWLIRIGINEALQRKRKSEKYKTVAITPENDVLQFADLSHMKLENRSINKDTKAFLEKVIDMLPQKYKIVFMLKEVEGMGISEISMGLDLTESNVKVRLHRARNMMRDIILDHTDSEDIFEFGNARCDKVVQGAMCTICELSGLKGRRSLPFG